MTRHSGTPHQNLVPGALDSFRTDSLSIATLAEAKPMEKLDFYLGHKRITVLVLLVQDYSPLVKGEKAVATIADEITNQSLGRRCRVCGCTDDRACEGGCSWVEQDLCSACSLEEVSV